MAKAYLALGSNLGDRRQTLRRAVDLLAGTPGVKVLAVSDMLETAPVGPPQGMYLNAAVELETALEPRDLLERALEIERELGRNRAKEPRWGPRTCDIDLLLMDNAVIESPELTLPHPRMQDRLFVLEPLAQIAPQAIHPVLKKTVAELLDDLKGRP